MSSLWTPEGEHPVGRDEARGPSEPVSQSPDPQPAPGQEDDELDDLSAQDREQIAEHLDDLRRQLLSTPAEVVVANHAYGLFELAAIHLSQKPPNLDDARLAIDAMAAVVEGLSGRLGAPERSLLDALAQIRLAFVQIGGTTTASDGEASAG